MSIPLQERLKTGEDAGAAFQRQAGPADAIARHLCALLNSETGGAIICGVEDDGTPVGVADAETVAANLQRTLSQLVSPPALFAVSAQDLGEVSLVVIDAPAGPDKPYVTGGGVWLRQGPHTQAADAPALRALFAAQEGEPERWERRLSASMRPDDLLEREILRLRDEARRSSRFDFTGEETGEEVLHRLGMTRPGGYTQAADILFANNPVVRHPQARVQLVAFATDEAGDDFSNFRSFEGPAVRLADEIAEALIGQIQIASSFRPDAMERRDTPSYARYALKEGVVNALVHRDYSSYSGSVKISVFPGRIEVWNTGRLPAGIRPEDLGRKHPSIPINPDIARGFFLRSLMDQIGRGGQRLAEECKAIGARPPEWSHVHGGVQLTLFAALGQAEARRALLNDRQRAYVEAVATGEALTIADYQRRFAPDVTDRQARRDLTELQTYRFLRREGAGRSTVYRRAQD